MILRLAAVGVGAVLLAGCATESRPLAFSELSHVHNVATSGEEILLASHHGLHVWEGGGWVLRGDDFDVMALTEHDGVLYASGHPGASQKLPDPLGLLVSSDAGATWQEQSLLGEVDFHLLSVSDAAIFGVAANYGAVIRSLDGGQTWTPVEVPSITDLSVNPRSGGEILIASEGNLLLSRDYGATFQTVEGPSGVQKVTWSHDAVVVSTGSTLFHRSTETSPFVALPHTFTNVSHFAVAGETIVVIDANGVSLSTNGGQTFTQLG